LPREDGSRTESILYQLKVDVVSFWPKRILGDAALPPDRRYTRTNIRNLTKDTALMPSGLLGPVRVRQVR
jgi:hypothetical protein